jgi:hypothetical protein
MLNVGLIGNTDILEPFTLDLKKNKQINIIGKASIGTSNHLNGFHFSIPEFNKVELIERADVILMDNSTPLSYNIYREIIKKSKHIFAVAYPNLTIDECTELTKLANESGSVVQVSNPYYFHPAIQWMNKEITLPAYIDYSNFEKDSADTKTLFPMLLMLIGTTGISPKKIGTVTFPGYNNSEFTNVRLEFGDASVVNLNYGTLDSLNEFKVRIYTDNQFVTFNFSKESYLCDNKPIDFSAFTAFSELQTFVESIANKKLRNSTLEDYLIAMHVAQKIHKKLAQFSTH